MIAQNPMRPRLSSLLLVVAALSCGPEFDPPTLVVNERVLAVIADPPEAIPGQEVVLTPLVVGPKGTLQEGVDVETSWWRCPDEDSDALGDFTRCTKPSDRVELGAGAVFTDVVPLDVFGELPEPGEDPATVPTKTLGALLGYWRVVGLDVNVTAPIAGGERRVAAIKREVVYSPVPLGELDPRLASLDVRLNEEGAIVENGNPSLGVVEIHDGTVDGPTVLAVEPGKIYWFKPRYDERTLQGYFSLKVDLAGLDLEDPEALKDISEDELLQRFEKVQRCEIPVFSWYATAGDLRREDTVDETVIERVYDPRGVPCPALEGEIREPQVRFVAPAADDVNLDAGIIHVWVVMRDGRGGSAFRAFDVPLVPPKNGGE